MRALPPLLGLAALLGAPACQGPDKVTEEDPVSPPLAVDLFSPENLLFPRQITVDAANRRVWVDSTTGARVAEIDADTAALVAIHTLPSGADGAPLAADGLGSVWTAGASGLALQRLHSGEDPVVVDVPLRRAEHVLALPTGGALVAGSQKGMLEEEPAVLVRVSATGAVETSRSLSGRVAALTFAEDGSVAVLHEDPVLTWAIERVDPVSLASLGSIPAPSSAEDVLAVGDATLLLDDEAVVAVEADSVVHVEEGRLNTDLLGLDEGFLVTDRSGDVERHVGSVKVYDSALRLVQLFATGQGSAYAAYDPVLGRVWIPAEDDSVVQAWDPHDGSETAVLAVGKHLESVIADPDDPDVVYIAGRLSGEVSRVDLSTGDIRVATGQPWWPVSPLLVDGELWVVDQLDGVLSVFDATTMESVADIDLGLPQVDSHHFDTLAWDPVRSWILLAEGDGNRLDAITPAGELVQSWTLGIPPAPTEAPGTTQVLVDGDTAYTVRTPEGVVTRIPLDGTGDVTSIVLDSAIQTVADHSSVGWPGFADGGHLWVGGFAFDGETLTRETARDLDVTRLLGRNADGMIAWDATRDAVVLIGDSGRTLQEIPLETTDGDPAPRYVPDWGNRVVWLDVDGVRVRESGW